MQALNEITTKNLHDKTGAIVRAVRAGQKYRVSIDGGRAAVLIPDESTEDATWDEIMAEVRAQRSKTKECTPNPVLAERNKRNYAAHLR